MGQQQQQPAVTWSPTTPEETTQQRENRRAVQKNASIVADANGVRGTVSTTGPNAFRDFIPLPESQQILTGGKIIYPR